MLHHDLERQPLLINDNSHPEDANPAGLREIIDTLMQQSAAFRNIVSEIAKSLKISVNMLLNTASTISIWAMIYNNLEGWPDTFRERSDELNEKMLYGFALACFINMAYELHHKRPGRAKTISKALFSLVQAASVGFATANFTEDTIIDADLQIYDPGSGSTSTSSTGLFWYGMFTPAVAVGFLHATMELSEAMYELAKENGIQLGKTVTDTISPFWKKITASSYTALRSLVRGSFMMGGMLNEFGNVLLDWLNIQISDYRAIYRTLLFIVPHFIGLLAEIGVKLFVKNEVTRKNIYDYINIAASLLNIVEYFTLISGSFKNDDDEAHLLHKFLPILVWATIVNLSVVTGLAARYGERLDENAELENSQNNAISGSDNDAPEEIENLPDDNEPLDGQCLSELFKDRTPSISSSLHGTFHRRAKSLDEPKMVLTHKRELSR